MIRSTDLDKLGATVSSTRYGSSILIEIRVINQLFIVASSGFMLMYFLFDLMISCKVSIESAIKVVFQKLFEIFVSFGFLRSILHGQLVNALIGLTL